MKITLNDDPLQLDTPMTIDALLTHLHIHQPGTALAINQAVIPRSDWLTHQLQDGDNILLFQAIAGG